MQKYKGISRALTTLAVTTLAGVMLAGCSDDDPDTASKTVELNNNMDRSLGQVELTFHDRGGVEIKASVENLAPGFYGFHIHEIGVCEPESQAADDSSETGDFLSAGSHVQGEADAEHPEHAGDLPVLLVNEDGSAEMTVFTDRLDESQLLDFDGAAVMIHAEPDNYANIPERYRNNNSDPDDNTLSTGDAGVRIGCGVIEGAVD